MKPHNVLILPGWEGSGPKHWQTLWEQRHGYRRVEQHDWTTPLRGDWVARLEDVVLSCDEPAVLVAHSLGCILTAAWAAASKNTQRVKAALSTRSASAARVRSEVSSSPGRSAKPSMCHSCIAGRGLSVNINFVSRREPAKFSRQMVDSYQRLNRWRA